MDVGIAHALHVGAAKDARLGDQQAIGRHLAAAGPAWSPASPRKSRRLRLLMPTQRRLQAQRPLELMARRAPRPARPCPARARPASRSAIWASSRQAAISRMQSAPHGPRLEHLVFIDHEVLAQHRQRAGRARLLQVLGRALEELHVGQHRQAGRAMLRIARRDLGRHEALAQHALAGAGLLDLGDHGRLALRRSCARRRLRSRAGHGAAARPRARRRGEVAPAPWPPRFPRA